jgi:hypothetical protein
LNEGSLKPSKEPVYAYALRHYTQHLETMEPSAENLERYRALVEDGWRRACHAREDGYQGFSRDVELAASAFRTAAERDPCVAKIRWRFTTKDARIKLRRLYPSIQT